jgi:hypothetical protein
MAETSRAELLKLLFAGAAAASAAPAAALAQPSSGGLAERVAQLEAHNEIHALMMAYGRTLDSRDFAGFEALWATEAEYVQGKGPGAKGPAAIRAVLEKAFATNAAGVLQPNFHVFFNLAIGPIETDRGSAFSRSAFVAANARGQLEVVIAAQYQDEFVHENGGWKFLRRVITADAPAPPAKA